MHHNHVLTLTKSPVAKRRRRRAFTLIEPFGFAQGKLPVVRKRAFTLIELLVVIAIIAMLVSILMPSLNRAKEMARAVMCRSGMRSVYLDGLAMYANDYDNQALCTYGSWATSTVHTRTWDRWLVDMKYISVPKDPDANTVSGSILVCPSNPQTYWTGSDEGRYHRNYAMNADAGYALRCAFGLECIGCRTTGSGVKYTHDELGDSMVFWITDSQDVKPYDMGYAENQYYHFQYSASEIERKINWIHSGGANFLFGDGHTDWTEEFTYFTDIPDGWKWNSNYGDYPGFW